MRGAGIGGSSEHRATERSETPATGDWFVSVVAMVALMLGETILPPEVLPLNHDNEDKQEDKSIERGVTTRAAGLVGVRSGFAPHLSNQEINVLRCLLEGDANKVIARRIHIAEATVRVYIKTILRKIRVENRTQAALWAMSNLSLLESKASGAPAKVASRPEVTTHCVRVSPETEKPETQMIEAGQAGEVPLDPKPEPSSSSGR
jgi:two-component system nitrate/nitrite response regulator NarL